MCFFKQYRLSLLDEKRVQFCGIPCGIGNSCCHYFNTDVQNQVIFGSILLMQGGFWLCCLCCGNAKKFQVEVGVPLC